MYCARSHQMVWAHPHTKTASQEPHPGAQLAYPKNLTPGHSLRLRIIPEHRRRIVGWLFLLCVLLILLCRSPLPCARSAAAHWEAKTKRVFQRAAVSHVNASLERQHCLFVTIDTCVREFFQHFGFGLVQHSFPPVPNRREHNRQAAQIPWAHSSMPFAHRMFLSEWLTARSNL